MARMTLAEFRTELTLRGFDGFEPDDLARYINWGHRHVARLTRALWEQADATAPLAVGDYDEALDVDGVGGGNFPYFKSMQSVNVRTSSDYRHLMPLQEHDFHTYWLPQDLSSSGVRGMPRWYFIWGATLFVLPPPTEAVTLEGHYYKRATDLVEEDDTSVAPADYDEGVLLAAEIRCHQRARQWEQAAVSRAALEELFTDVLADEAATMNDRQTQIIPDRRWR